MWRILAFGLLFVNYSYSYKLLVIIPTNSVSHFKMNEPLLIELTKRGHEVDVVSAFPRKTALPRYNDIDISASSPGTQNNVSMRQIEDLHTFLDNAKDILDVDGIPTCKSLFAHEALRKLRNSSKKYHLLIIELFSSDCMLGFAHHFKAPYVATASSVILPWGNDRIGNPDNPSYVPNYFSSFTHKMTFMERFWNTVEVVVVKWLYDLVYMRKFNEMARDFFGDDLPDLRQIAFNVSLILVNSHVSLNYPRPAVNNFIEVGGLHIGDLKPLPTHLEEFLNQSSQGVIYFSLGSMMQSETLEESKLRGLFDAFAELPCKILFKGNRDAISRILSIPSNVHVELWVPQLEVLCHPNVKIFITHGGLLGIQEAVYCEVPIIGIPLFSDQFSNVRHCESNKLGTVVPYNQINKETILQAARLLLDDPIYKHNAVEASKLFKDRQNKPLETAVYWVEYVARHKGAPHLRSSGADLPWYQLYLVDVFCILVVIFVTTVGAIIFATKLITRLFRKPQKKAKLS